MLKANSVEHLESNLARVLSHRCGVELKRILILQHCCFSSSLILHEENAIYRLPTKYLQARAGERAMTRAASSREMKNSHTITISIKLRRQMERFLKWGSVSEWEREREIERGEPDEERRTKRPSSFQMSGGQGWQPGEGGRKEAPSASAGAAPALADELWLCWDIEGRGYDKTYPFCYCVEEGERDGGIFLMV